MKKLHTIILIQYNESILSRTYMEFDSIHDGMEGIVKLYEHRLKEDNRRTQSISYSTLELNLFIDSLFDIVALIYDPDTKKYFPKDREWIKNSAHSLLSLQSL